MDDTVPPDEKARQDEKAKRDEKIQRIAGVLLAMSEDLRFELVLQMLPHGYAVVPRQCDPQAENAFKSAASRLHAGLRSELKFNPLAIRPCYQAMIEASELKRTSHRTMVLDA